MSHPLSDVVHVLAKDIVHVPQVSGHELLLGFGSALLLLAESKIREIKHRAWPLLPL